MKIVKHVSLTRIPGNRTSLKWSSFAHVLSELEQWAKFSSSSKHGSQNLLPFFVWWVLSKISNFRRNKRKKTIKIRIFINICGCKPSIINRFAIFFPYIDIYYWRPSLQVRYPSVGCRFVVLLVVGTKTNKMARCPI